MSNNLLHIIYFLAGKPEGKTSLGRPRRRWKNNIKTDLKVIRWEGTG
jgi:hypothetical protein